MGAALCCMLSYPLDARSLLALHNKERPTALKRYMQRATLPTACSLMRVLSRLRLLQGSALTASPPVCALHTPALHKSLCVFIKVQASPTLAFDALLPLPCAGSRGCPQGPGQH
eukprot:1161045-Pelagomonas_calceolata.AAC.16